MVRNAEKAKTPVMCVVGEKEREDGEALISACNSSLDWDDHRRKAFPAVAHHPMHASEHSSGMLKSVAKTVEKSLLPS